MAKLSALQERQRAATQRAYRKELSKTQERMQFIARDSNGRLYRAEAKNLTKGERKRISQQATAIRRLTKYGDPNNLDQMASGSGIGSNGDALATDSYEIMEAYHNNNDMFDYDPYPDRQA